jgi:nucleoside 2-deoxyribosyltransferase
MFKVYLAGPEVFLPNAAEIGAAKKRICAAHGLEGLFPLDQGQPPLPPGELGTAIYRANVRLMKSADAIIANLTPFRGAAMDVGTAFEIGFCAARGLKLFGYANVRALLTERIGHDIKAGVRVDENGWVVEDFGFFENLMIDVPLRECGEIVTIDAPLDEQLSNLAGFERAVKRAAEILA